ncbi:hypothetical protein GUJ93_ZPchr0004g39964 [Zizania palustris]|uniref:Uncharacterized protein n=1 Tax=Zizania palustris TaxID=103762 RepID=A0A8J5V8W7_ZIZPA|nr:hypothetical protein GUJ93_ZPchr0004g39964 [Zizania palustris]
MDPMPSSEGPKRKRVDDGEPGGPSPRRPEGPYDTMETSRNLPEAMDVEVPSTAKAFDDGAEVECSGPKAEGTCSGLRVVAMDSEAVAPEPTSTGLDSEGYKPAKEILGGSS